MTKFFLVQQSVIPLGSPALNLSHTIIEVVYFDLTYRCIPGHTGLQVVKGVEGFQKE